MKAKYKRIPKDPRDPITEYRRVGKRPPNDLCSPDHIYKVSPDLSHMPDEFFKALGIDRSKHLPKRPKRKNRKSTEASCADDLVRFVREGIVAGASFDDIARYEKIVELPSRRPFTGAEIADWYSKQLEMRKTSEEEKN